MHPWKDVLPGYRTVLVGTFFGALLLLGIAIHDDFGLSWDEKTQYLLGKEAYEAVFEGKEYPTNTGYRYHGAALEILFHMIRASGRFESVQSIFFMRHFVNFLTFYLGVAFFYMLAKHMTRSWKLGLLGSVLLVLSPTIFGHAFVNSRDIPTMSLFIISMWTLVNFLERRSVLCTVAHALVCALLIDIRMTGVFMPALTGFMLALETFDTRQISLRQGFPFLVYIAALATFTIAFWPLLWEHPIQNFLQAYAYMSTKSAGGFYMGNVLNENPWHWIPVWMGISTPLLYTALFFVGIGDYLRTAVREPRSLLRERRNDLLVLLWFFGPIFAIIVLKAGIFDSWRHVFFIYPAFLLIALNGVGLLHRKLGHIGRGALAGFLAVSIGLTGLWMVQNHPMEYVYFSVPSSLVEGNFELDYWGLSFRQGLEWLLAHDSDKVIPVTASSSPAFSTINILKPEHRRRIFFTGTAFTPKYVLDNFQWQKYQKVFPEENKVYSVTVGAIEVMAIYRNPKWEPYAIDPGAIPDENAVIFY